MNPHDENADPRELAANTAEEPIDIVSEWGYESFPASDPPQSWCYGRSTA